MEKISNTNTKLLQKVAKEQLENATNVSNLENKVDDLKITVDSLKDGMVRILSIIDNDDKTGTPGIVKQTRNNSNRLDTVESKISTYDTKISTTIGIFAFLSIVGQVLLNIFWIKK